MRGKSSTMRVVGGALGGTAVIIAGSMTSITPAFAVDGSSLELLVVGSPYSPIPEPFATIVEQTRIGDAWQTGATSMSDIGGLSSEENTVVVTPQCTNPSDPDNNVPRNLVQVELGVQIAYQYKKAGVAANLCDISEIDTFQLTFNLVAGSCLVSGRPDQLATGAYPLTKDQVPDGEFPGLTNFKFNPFAQTNPAYIAQQGGTNGDFSSADVLGGGADKWQLTAYLPATRPCAPPTGPEFTGTAPFATNTGRLGVSPASIISQIQAQSFTTGISMGSGGGGRFNLTQIMADGTGILGAKRIQAFPTNTGTGGPKDFGGYRNDGLFVQCGANNVTTQTTVNTRCRLATGAGTGGTVVTLPPTGVRVTNGGALSGGLRYWTASGTGEVGQTVKFRSREVSWVGYGLHSPETSGTMTNGN